MSKDNNEKAASDTSIGRYLWVGLAFIIVLVGGVGAWATLASISGAVIAPASIVVESHRKDVQHLQGGIVGEILVKDGDKVETGDLLVRLDKTLPKANLGIITTQLDELLARKARLEAELAGRKNLRLPSDLTDRASETAISSIVEGQVILLKARTDALAGQRAQLRERVGQLEQEIVGLEAQRAAKVQEIALIEDELKGLRKLKKRGLVPKTRVASLERQAAQLNGDRGRLIAEIARAKGRISETEIEVLQLEKDRRTEVVTELREVQTKIAELSERRAAAEDQLRRIEIRAPIGGYVHQMAFHTVGGVVQAGQTLMQIVPASDVLLVEARLEPTDIDQVVIEQEAIVRFPGFNQRTTPELKAKVRQVSADVTRDTTLDIEFYTVRVALSAAEIKRLGSRDLLPGMPAEVFFQTGQRSALSYLVKPLLDQITRAFREE